MKRISLYTGRFALTGVAAAALWFTVPDVHALGLGRLSVQSSLGESLRAEIDVTSLSPEEASNLNVHVAPPEAYRAAGVDYNSVLSATQVVLMRRADGRPYLRITSDRTVQEPFVDVILELSWSTGRLVREYTALFDPPTTRTPMAAATPAPAPMPATSPVISAAPTPAPAAPSRERRSRPAPAPAPTSNDASAPPRAAASGGGSIDEYRVRPGDTLSRIAGRTQRSGVSLDQMLVSLYRSNPQAFMGDNMNRLKSGSVLNVPSAEEVKSIPQAQARETIQAQSADFGAYRQRLASGVPAAKTESSSRTAGGKVQANVEDRKQAASATPDKLTLRSAPGSPASMAEDRASKERERADASKRQAELTRNVEELKRLSGATTAASANKSGSGAPAPAASAPPPAVVSVAPPVPVPPPPAPAPAPTAPVASAPSPEPAPVAAAPTASPVDVAASEPASGVATAQVSPPVPAPAPPPVAPPPAEPPPSASFFEDNPLPLAIGGVLVALLAGFGVYRFSRRSKKDSGETSFLESRLQPDSFFGASGGQRIDTRDAAGASSSMSYSLSQLDAIGDVDPVAEADVYLAYGRDLQAEEILKEAMRGNPERLAIRTKLLEVYAKRRDTKGFELLATQLYGLTRGEGEDWAKAQELGQQIDPENPLYQPGGAPAHAGMPGDRSAEPLGASTMPQSVLPSPSRFEAAAREEAARAQSSGSVDLDLDLDLAKAPAKPAGQAPKRAGFDNVIPAAALTVPDLPTVAAPAVKASPRAAPAPAPAEAGHSVPMDFDLGEISLDLDKPVITRPQGLDSSNPPLENIDFSGDDSGDPLARKLELAEEFRLIGDNEGARELVQEVIAKADGSLRMKAQEMLDGLG